MFSRILYAALVPRTRSSHNNCRESDCELRVQSGTGIIDLLVSLRFRSSHRSVRRALANFGIGTLAGLALALIPAGDAVAHCFVGARFLPATLVIDDPCVADELSLPTIARFSTGDDPSLRETDISGEFSKRITDTFGVSIARTWTHLGQPTGLPDVSGFQNWETTFKHQFLTDAAHEFVMSAALVVEWGGTGSPDVGAERFSTLTPMLYFGKGFGDLPESAGWLRAFALTGQVGYSIPTSSSTVTVDPDTGLLNFEFHPQFWVYGASLQFSFPYLKSNVSDLGLPDFINRLIPIVEAQFQTPAANLGDNPSITTGTINPGVIFAHDTFQVGVEAIIPINRASGTGIGVVAQLHLYLDDIFPNTIGRPLFSSTPAPTKPFGG